MKNIKINGKPFAVKTLSELTFNEYNEIMIKAECNDIKSYLSLYINMPVEELLRSEMTGASIPALTQSIFNIDKKSVIDAGKDSVTLNGEIQLCKDIGVDQFGKSYLFALLQMKHRSEEINVYELSLWALAIALLEDKDIANMEKAQENYDHLANQLWKDVLPQAFFFLKLTVKPKTDSIRLSRDFMRGLKKISLVTRISMKLSVVLEQRLLSSSYAKYLTKLMTSFSRWT